MMVKIETDTLVRAQIGMTLDLLKAYPFDLRTQLLAAVDEYDKEMIISSDGALAYLKSNLRSIIDDIIDEVLDYDDLPEIITTTDSSDDSLDIDALTDLDTPHYRE